MLNTQQGETPTLARVILDTIENRLCDLHVSLPGKVLSYDPGTQKAKIQLQIKRKYVDGTDVEIPPVVDVPVAWPRAGKSYLHLPLKAGHQVMVVFSERSLDEWKEQGGSQAPEIFRKHSYSDAWAIPGGYPFNDVIEGDPANAKLVNDKTVFELSPSGKMAMTGQGGEELVTIVSELLAILKAATTNTIFGPMRLNEHPQIIELETRLNKLKL